MQNIMANTATASRIKRISIVALIFMAQSLFHIIFHGSSTLRSSILQLQPITQNNSNSTSQHITSISRPRLQYIRPRGNERELLAIFDEISNRPIDRLPKTAEEIARKYGLPKTSRDVKCYATDADGTVTVGWIPSTSSLSANNIDEPYSYSGRIPRLIFQTWKTNRLQEDLCEHILVWTQMNPDYDYFLFDDNAMDRFLQLEYGEEIFSSFACIKVGAAKSDVWRLLIIYLFGGMYFDFDTRLRSPFEDWGWEDDCTVVTGRGCWTKMYPNGCAHQWGLIYAPKHPVIHSAIRETLINLAERRAEHVYDVSFWAYYHAWRHGPYNQSYMPGWGDNFGGRVSFQENDVKDIMVEGGTKHWPKAKQIWHPECM